MRGKIKALGFLLLIVFAVASVWAEGKKEEGMAYPERSINMIVGFPAGGPTDVIARGIVPVLQEEMGVGIGINNMPGASSGTAADFVLKQPADGYTLFMGSEALSVLQTMDIMDIHPYNDFTCVKLVAEAYPVLAVPPDSQFESAEEFVQYAIDNPGELRVGTAGPATVPHVSGLILQKNLGAEFTFVPFKGGTPAITAVMGGQVDATIEMIQSMIGPYRGGKLNILASFTNEPIPGLANEIPPIGTLIPELQSDLPYGPYFGLFVKKGTPQEIIDYLVAKMDVAVKSEHWIEYSYNRYMPRIDYEGQPAYDYLVDWTAKAAWLLWDTGAGINNPADIGIPRP